MGVGDGSQPELDAMAARLWPRVVRDIDGLVALSDDDHSWSARRGTPMAGDDRASRPFQQSHAFQMLLNAGIDNLNGVRHLTFGRPDVDHGGQMVIHQAAHYVLARGAIENFATALWLIGPRSRPQRIERLMRWHVQNVNDQHRAVDRFVTTGGKTRAQKLEQLEGLCAASTGEVPRGFARGYTTTEAVLYVDGLRNVAGPLSTHFVWQLRSGFAHARHWASLHFLERDLQPTEDPDVMHARMTSSMGRALMAAGLALDLCETLLERYRRLNTPTFAD